MPAVLPSGMDNPDGPVRPVGRRTGIHIPPGGLTESSWTVQFDDAPPANVAASHDISAILAGGASGVNVMAASRELALQIQIAVTAAVWPTGTGPAVAVNTALADPELTVTEGGTLRERLSLAKRTVTPFALATLDRVTEQVEDDPEDRVEGAQANWLNAGGAVRVIVVCWDLPPELAVTVAV